jgi:MFS family permease
MSFRLFVYYCAVIGGGMAYVAWALGRIPDVENTVGQAGLQGLFLGLTVAFGLGLVDALWNLSGRRIGLVLGRVLVAVVVGSLGGFFGGAIGQLLYGRLQFSVFLLLGWTITGLLVGSAPGVFDVLARLMRDEDLRGARRKVVNGMLGGSLGGLLGGLLFLLLQAAWHAGFKERADDFWSPSATGFVALGACIGLLIGLAQVILKEAWLKVESGFRAGRELILSRPETTIGRAEGCDVGLFGDNTVERRHARIVKKGGRYLLLDDGSPSGTFLNGERIPGPMPLRSGDEIRVGRNTLRFRERVKRGGAVVA